MFRALLGMPLIHKTLINIFLQKLPILQAQIVFYSAKTAKARGCINRAILEEKYLSKFYDVFSSWESTWSNKWVCEGCNTADIFKIFKRQILTALCALKLNIRRYVPTVGMCNLILKCTFCYPQFLIFINFCNNNLNVILNIWSNDILISQQQ